MPISSIDRAQEEIVELLEAGKSISDVVNHWIQTDPQVIALLLLEHRAPRGCCLQERPWVYRLLFRSEEV